MASKMEPILSCILVQDIKQLLLRNNVVSRTFTDRIGFSFVHIPVKHLMK